MIDVRVLAHARLFKSLSEFRVLGLIPQTGAPVTLALFNVSVCLFIDFKNLGDFRGVVLGLGKYAKG